MKLAVRLLAAALVAAPAAAEAATIYFDETDFFAALGGAPLVTQGFAGLPSGQLASPTVFSSGISVSPSVPSPDNFLDGTVLRLSVDNSGSPTTPDVPSTTSVAVSLPNPATAFAFGFGNAAGDSGGIGNNSGTTLTAGSFSYNFSTLFGSPGIGYVGFFGVIGDPGQTFTNLVFSSNGIGTFTDDDFRVRSIAFAPVEPIPLPAGLPLLATGLLAFGLLRRRRAR